MTTEFQFDWQKEPEGFLKWFVPSALTPEDITTLNEAEPEWTENLRVLIMINGREVDAGKFLASVERNMEHFAREQARKMIEHVDVSRLTDTVQGILDWTKDEMLRAFHEHGIDLPEEVW